MNNIKSERVKKKMSQQILADAAGISRTGLSLIENGVSEPKIDTLKKLSEALNISWTALVDDFVDTNFSNDK